MSHKLPNEMTVRELKESIGFHGLSSQTLGFTEKREFVDLLTRFIQTETNPPINLHNATLQLCNLPSDILRYIILFLQLADAISMENTCRFIKGEVGSDKCWAVFMKSNVLKFPRDIQFDLTDTARILCKICILKQQAIHVSFRKGKNVQYIAAVVGVSSVDRPEESPSNILTESICNNLYTSNARTIIAVRIQTQLVLFSHIMH